MGCQMALTVADAQRALAERALDDGQRLVEQIEAHLSRFRPDSELSRLNARAGSWTAVSPLLGEALTAALRAARRTGGLCSPTLLDALEAAGYDRDFAEIATCPAGADVAVRPEPLAARAPRHVVARRLRPPRPRYRAGQAWRAIRLAENPPRVWVPGGVGLDLAGVEKGWTADRVADVLAQAGPCLVDAGGDLAVRGAPAGLAGWPIAVADPLAPDADFAQVLVRDAGIATSGVDFRRWSRQGRPQHHLIDPRTGEPSRTDALTVSVIALTTEEADGHAKAALLLGVRGGLSYLCRRQLAGLIVGRDGRSYATPRWSVYALER